MITVFGLASASQTCDVRSMSEDVRLLTLTSTGPIGSAGTYAVDGGKACNPTTTCVSVLSGDVTVDFIDQQQNARGSYAVHLVDGTVLNGSFEAGMCISDMLCG